MRWLTSHFTGPARKTAQSSEFKRLASMKSPEYLLSVTAAKNGDIVTIHCDRAGLEVLRDRINELIVKLAHDECDHEHLRSPDWAGAELTTTMLADERQSGHSVVHHLELFGWSAEWRAKHDL